MTSSIHLPEELYDAKDSLTRGGIIRACGYLMRLRVQYLLEQPEGTLGLRRALHACMFTEVIYNTYQTARDAPKADRLFGLFQKELGWKVLMRLAESKATLLPDELRFADIEWWKSLDVARSQHERLSNLDRMFGCEESECLLAGVEMHILLDALLLSQHGGAYESILRQRPQLSSDPFFIRAYMQVQGLLLIDQVA